MLNANRVQTNTISDNISDSRSRIKPRFQLVVHIEDSDIDDMTEVIEVYID